MKVRMLSTYANSERAHAAGSIADFEGKEAEQLIAGGYAAAVDGKGRPDLERTAEVREKATGARGREKAAAD